MSNFSALKTAIQTAIKQNGNNEITGDILQDILLSIVSTLGDSAINNLETGLQTESQTRGNDDAALSQAIENEATARGNQDTQLGNLITGIKNNIDNGYVYAGIATPSITPVSGKVFYIATQAGTYTNLGNTAVKPGISILKYNGSAWSNEQVIYTDGGVFDVSAYNGDATYASLEALLSDANLSTIIPSAVRRGGMSIKFVHTDDNKYVQYRLKSQNFTSNVAYWQGVDYNPVAGSDNLIYSGGVKQAVSKLEGYHYHTDTFTSVVLTRLFAMNDMLVTLKIKNVSFSGTSFYVGLRSSSDVTLGYLKSDGTIASGLTWLTIASGSMLTISDASLPSDFSYFAIGSNTQIQSGQVEIWIDQDGEIEKLEEDIDEVSDIANQTKTAYCECDTAADVNVKTVSCPGFVLNDRVRILVKMTYANTVFTNVSLSINGTAGKGIFYNGMRIYKYNTWAAGEVLDISYYNNNYYARTYSGVVQFNGYKKDTGISQDLFTKTTNAIYDRISNKQDISDYFDSEINNTSVSQIYDGKITTVPNIKTRIYYFEEATDVFIHSNSKMSCALFDEEPVLDASGLLLVTGDEMNDRYVTIPSGKYLAASYYNASYKVDIYKIINKPLGQPYLSIYSSLDKKFNNLSFNVQYLTMAIEMIKRKMVDKTNRLCISFNGDSIIGSQLDNITLSPEYNTGAFPPNMSKMIMARMFYDTYKFSGEDTQFRNLIHSDWTKVDFDVNQNKGDKTKGFNEIEVYGCSSSEAYAQITVTGYKYFKLIWSHLGYNKSWTCYVNVSVDGGEFMSPSTVGMTLPASVGKSSGKITNLVYHITELDPTKEYTFKITPGTNPEDIGFWGCEYWNNPRLDVVMQAVSGTTAYQNKNWMPNAYYQEENGVFSYPHKPALVITDILCSNDASYISGNVNGENYHWYLESQAYIYELLKSKGVPVLAFAPHYPNTVVTPEKALMIGAKSIAMNYGVAMIDIPLKMQEDAPSESIVGPDGSHLSDYGNSYYFAEIQRIMNAYS